MTYNSTYDLSNMDVEYREHIALCVKENEVDAEKKKIDESIFNSPDREEGKMAPIMNSTMRLMAESRRVSLMQSSQHSTMSPLELRKIQSRP